MHRGLKIAATGALLLLGAAAESSAQQSQPAPEQAQVQGSYEGERAAREVAAARWMGTGLLGGIVLGPIGAAANFMLASRGDATVPPELIATAEERGPMYSVAFQEAYRARVRSNRRVGALVGGVTGSLIFGFVIMQISNWGEVAGTPPDTGSGPPLGF